MRIERMLFLRDSKQSTVVHEFLSRVVTLKFVFLAYPRKCDLLCATTRIAKPNLRIYINKPFLRLSIVLKADTVVVKLWEQLVLALVATLPLLALFDSGSRK